MSSQPHRDNIDATLASMFTANTTQGVMTTGSFAYTEAAMKTIIQNWLDLADSYRRSGYNAVLMARIDPPAEDFASRAHSSAANRSGEAYRRYLQHNEDYCTQQAELFQSALDEYLGIENTTATEMNRTAPEGPRPKV